MWRSMLACVAVLCGAQLGSCKSSLRYDNEFSWTRSGWHDDKAPFFLHDALLTGLAKTAEWGSGPLAPSVLGPNPAATLSAAAHRNIMHGDPSDSSQNPEATNPLLMIHSAAASELMQCDVCTDTATQVWEGVIDDVHARLNAPSLRASAAAVLADPARFEGACTDTQMAAFLTTRLVREVRPRAAAGSTGAPGFAMCTRSVRQKVVDAEILAATRACEDVVDEHVKPTFTAGVWADEVAKYHSQYQTAIKKDSTRRVPEGMTVLDCVDKHSLCGTWAAIGECHANPNYMVGRPEAAQKGHCRRSCGRCGVYDPFRAMPPETRRGLVELAAKQQDEFVTQACHEVCDDDRQLFKGSHAACWPNISDEKEL